MNHSRRRFIRSVSLFTASLAALPARPGPLLWAGSSGFFGETGLCELSLAPSLAHGKLQHLDFAARAKRNWNISLVEYGSVFFNDNVSDRTYLQEMLNRAKNAGVTGIRINISNEGFLGDPDAAKRKNSVENHFRWIEAAARLECPSVSLCLEGEGSADDVRAAALESMRILSESGKKSGVKVYAMNTVGHSANASWLAGLMRELNDTESGLVVDLASFCLQKTIPASQDPADLMHVRCLDSYDRYQGVKELMPFARGLHARTKKFDGQGNDIETDYYRMAEIIRDSDYKGPVSIAYEGGIYLPADQCSYYNDDRGIQLTLDLLNKASAAATIQSNNKK